MAKTVKYTIEFHAIETPLSTEIQLSGKEFDKQLKFLLQQTLDTKDNEYPVETNATEQDYTGYTVTRYRFSIATSGTNSSASASPMSRIRIKGVSSSS